MHDNIYDIRHFATLKIKTTPPPPKKKIQMNKIVFISMQTGHSNEITVLSEPGKEELNQTYY